MRHHYSAFEPFLIGGLLLFVGGMTAWSELPLTFEGVSTRAEVVSMVRKTESGSRNSRREYIIMQYVFRDANGVEHGGFAEVGNHWEAPEDGLIEIRYMPQNPEVNRYGSSDLVLAVACVLGGLVFLVLFFPRSFVHGNEGGCLMCCDWF